MNNLDFLWFCTLQHDGEYLGTRELPPRQPTLESIANLIDTAGEQGFSSLLTATNYHSYHENFTVSAAALARSRNAGLLVAVRTGMFDAAIYAKMAATLANLFPGRVRINIVTGSSTAENAMYGDFESHAERYERTEEFTSLVRRLLGGEVITHESPRYPMRGAYVSPLPPSPVPIYFGGHSADAQRIAARHADTYLLWGDTMQVVESRLAGMRVQQAAAGRELRCGLRCHVVVRETEAEAWAAAERMISRIDPDVRRAFVAAAGAVDSEGQRRQQELAASTSLVVEANLWAGVGLARSGVAVAIVGDPAQVTAKLRAYQHLGISTFILSGYPHLEECRRFGQLVMPLLRASAPAITSSAMVAPSVAPVT